MRNRVNISLVLFLLLVSGSSFSQQPILVVDTLKKIAGCWQGTLTYLDYTTGKPFSMSANLNIKQIGKTNSFAFLNAYPKEPQANSIDTIIISNDGRSINKEIIRSIRQLNDSTTEIITEETGIDGNDNKTALFRYTYILSSAIYSNKKEVQFAGQSEWITRHEYSYKRCHSN